MDNENTTVTNEELDAFDSDWDDVPSDYQEAEELIEETAPDADDEGDTQPNDADAHGDATDVGDNEPAEEESESEQKSLRNQHSTFKLST